MPKWNRISPALMGGWRTVFTLAIVYVFIVVLLTAAAQQQVTAALSDAPGKLDYSSALARVQETEEIQERVEDLAKQEERLAREVRALEYKLPEVRAAADEAWSGFQPIAGRLIDRGDCGAIEAQDRFSRWNWFMRCMDAIDLPSRDRSALNALRTASPNPADLYREQLTEERQLSNKQTALSDVREKLTEARQAVSEGEALRGSFDEMNVLRDGWWAAKGIFSHFPPILLNIFLALASGAFGALLVTIILTVYPSNTLQFRSGSVFELRVLLGGLIAVCVYVVLSGGTAVLGDSPSLADGQVNVMTFCAVGILAGMFSDRVASWLSEKADMFFSPTGGSHAQPKEPDNG